MDEYIVGDEVMVKIYEEWRYGIIQSLNEDNTVNVVLVRKIIVNHQTREARSSVTNVERDRIRKVFKNTNQRQSLRVETSTKKEN